MASKVLLFAAVAVAAFAYATANECYVCNSAITPDCAKTQGKNSNTFNCASQTPISGQDYVCAKTAFEVAGVQQVQRTCLEKRLSCKDLENQYKAQGIEVKECKTCSENLCNGQ